jgi:hypothetical protein
MASCSDSLTNCFLGGKITIACEIGKAGRGNVNAGWSSLVARRAHNPEVTGSNPVPATKKLLFGSVFYL